MRYRISGSFPDGCEGYNVFDYLPHGADQLRFFTEERTIECARSLSVGPDVDGIEPTFEAKEVE